MKTISILTLGLLLLSCGPRRPGKLGTAGKAGTSMGIEVFDVPSGGACLSGGLSLSTFKDNNSNGLLDPSETVVKISLICNGLNGSNGNDGQNGSNGTSASVSLESVAAGQECPSGGVKLSSSSSPNSQIICNGSNGLAGLDGDNGADGENGSNGSNGENGLNGIAGQAGTVVTPVKFCSNDNSNFPEYGLMIGTELFAVYWGKTPASPHKDQAFLAKITPGNYQSTGGNNCNFTIL